MARKSSRYKLIKEYTLEEEQKYMEKLKRRREHYVNRIQSLEDEQRELEELIIRQSLVIAQKERDGQNRL